MLRERCFPGPENLEERGKVRKGVKQDQTQKTSEFESLALDLEKCAPAI